MISIVCFVIVLYLVLQRGSCTLHLTGFIMLIELIQSLSQHMLCAKQGVMGEMQPG